MSIADNLQAIQAKTSSFDYTLVAVSKTKPMEALAEAYDAGQRDFGENKVQELVEKAENMHKDILWHMIGHLQRNKVKYIAPFVHLIHGVDSPRLLAEINKQATKCERQIQCLLQIHIAEEDTKFGFDPEEITSLLSEDFHTIYPMVNIVGLMGMASNTDVQEQVRKEFAGLKSLFDSLKDSTHPNVSMQHLSMGMSGDYHIALEEGSSMIRVGSAIFGARNYT